MVALGIMQDLGVNGRITYGRMVFKGRDLSRLSPTELRALRSAGIAMIYQEPVALLNPAMTIGRPLMEVPIPSGSHRN